MFSGNLLQYEIKINSNKERHFFLPKDRLYSKLNTYLSKSMYYKSLEHNIHVFYKVKVKNFFIICRYAPKAGADRQVLWPWAICLNMIELWRPICYLRWKKLFLLPYINYKSYLIIHLKCGCTCVYTMGENYLSDISMKDIASSHFLWPRIYHSIEEFIKSREICALNSQTATKSVLRS